jgi:acylphosphatase
MRRRRCWFSGRVQGVGFRYTAQSIASRHAVAGYVKNLADGRVELVMEGNEAEMEQVVEEISRRMEGFIAGRSDELSEATGEFEEFTVRQ